MRLEHIEGLVSLEGLEGLEVIERLEHRSWVFGFFCRFLTLINQKHKNRTGKRHTVRIKTLTIK